jgi:MYXO-CTERM domain-containing protein
VNEFGTDPLRPYTDDDQDGIINVLDPTNDRDGFPDLVDRGCQSTGPGPTAAPAALLLLLVAGLAPLLRRRRSVGSIVRVA